MKNVLSDKDGKIKELTKRLKINKMNKIKIIL